MKSNAMYLNLGLHRGFESLNDKFDSDLFIDNCANLHGNAKKTGNYVEIFDYPISKNDLTELQFELYDYLTKYNCELIKRGNSVIIKQR